VLNLAAISISGIALAISEVLLWKQHLKSFRLWCRFQSSVFDGLDYKGQGFHIILPITVANKGARPGVITNWAVYLRKRDNSKEVFVYHGAGSVDVATLIDALRKGDVGSAKILQGGIPVTRLGGGEQRDMGILFVAPEVGRYTKTESQGFRPTAQLSTGKYDLELWCFVRKWARYHKVGLELTSEKVDKLKQSLYFVNNHVPEFDLLKPDLDPNPRGKS